jgi:hypothetical protein
VDILTKHVDVSVVPPIREPASPGIRGSVEDIEHALSLPAIKSVRSKVIGYSLRLPIDAFGDFAIGY